MSNLERIKAKYRKLLTLGMESTNEHEARNALLKAAQLLRKYQIEEGDALTEHLEIITKKRYVSTSLIRGSESILFNGICKANGVFLVKSSHKGNYKSHYIMVGTEPDIEISEYIMDVCLDKIKWLMQDYRQENQGLRPRDYNDYEMGLCLGKSHTFYETAKEAEFEGSTALVPVDSRRQSAEREYRKHGSTRTGVTRYRDSSHTNKGMADGRKIATNAGVGGSKLTQKALK